MEEKYPLGQTLGVGELYFLNLKVVPSKALYMWIPGSFAL